MKKVKHRLSICAVALMVSAFSMTVLADTLRGDTNNDGTTGEPLFYNYIRALFKA